MITWFFYFIPYKNFTQKHTLSDYSLLLNTQFDLSLSLYIYIYQSMEKKILVAVDEGEESSYALSWCLKNLINNPNDTLILLYAKPPRTIYPSTDGAGYLFSSDIILTMERYGNEVAESVMQRAKRLCKDYEVKVETRVENGDARDVICEVAEKLNVDVVVLGSHGYGAIKRAFLGSVSNHCAQNIKCPVLIVKKPKNSTPPPAAASASTAHA